MKLYLMQHGNAMSKAENPERPLSEQGQQDVERISTFLARSKSKISEIRHSGKRRTEETAHIVARHLKLQKYVVKMDGLRPNDDVRPVAEILQKEAQAVMIVGHLPFLSRLASYLLVKEPEHMLIQFQQGGILCLDKEENWTVEWMVVPAIV